MRFPTVVLFPLCSHGGNARDGSTQQLELPISLPQDLTRSLTIALHVLNMSSAAAVPAGREWGLQPTYTVLDLESPRVLVTVAREAIIPGRIGVRKDWKPLGLLKFTGKADVELRTGAITYGFSCKDNIIGGRFSVNVPDRLLEYRKKLRLPNGASIALSGGCQYVETGGPQLRDRFKPMLAVQVQLGDMGAGNAVWSGDGFDLKNKIPTPLLDYPKLEFEVYSSVKVPLLMARYSIQHGGTVGSLNSRRGPRGLSPQDENKPLHLHLSQTNLVFRF